MLEKKLSFEEVFDIYGFRITVSDLNDCYLALGIIHQHFKPLPENLKTILLSQKIMGINLYTLQYLQIIVFQLKYKSYHKYA